MCSLVQGDNIQRNASFERDSYIFKFLLVFNSKLFQKNFPAILQPDDIQRGHPLFGLPDAQSNQN
jgi:hypothetical protein